MPDPSDDKSAAPSLSAATRNVVSVVLFVHLFCVAVALSANIAHSPLQERLDQTLRIYTQPLNIHLYFKPYYLMHQEPMDFDHRLEVLDEGGDETKADDWIFLAGSRNRAGEAYKRYQRLGRAMAYLADQREDDRVGLLATGVLSHRLRQVGTVPAQVRCRRHFALTPERASGGTPSGRDPWGADMLSEAYRARAVVLNGELIGITKVDPEGQVARPVEDER